MRFERVERYVWVSSGKLAQGYNRSSDMYCACTRAECMPVTGDSLRCEIRWKNQPDLSALKGKNIRLKISGLNLIAYSASFER